jgi:hypothetical protein
VGGVWERNRRSGDYCAACAVSLHAGASSTGVPEPPPTCAPPPCPRRYVGAFGDARASMASARTVVRYSVSVPANGAVLAIVSGRNGTSRTRPGWLSDRSRTRGIGRFDRDVDARYRVRVLAQARQRARDRSRARRPQKLAPESTTGRPHETSLRPGNSGRSGRVSFPREHAAFTPDFLAPRRRRARPGPHCTRSSAPTREPTRQPVPSIGGAMPGPATKTGRSEGPLGRAVATRPGGGRRWGLGFLRLSDR